MFYPPVLDLQSYLRAKDKASLDTSSAENAINMAMAVINNFNNDAVWGCHISDGSDMIKAILWAAFVS
jgi:hypothetical protein